MTWAHVARYKRVMRIARVLLPLTLTLVHCGGDVPPPAPPPVVVVPPSPPPPPKGPQPPETSKVPVTTAYHTFKVTDDYAWLESNTDPKVSAWSDAQNAFTHATLDAYPDRAAIRKRVAELDGEDSPSYGDLEVRGSTLFVMKTQPPKQQAFLVTVAALADVGTEKVLLDPNALDASGKTTIDWFVPSHDGKRVAVSLSVGGSESGDVHVYDVATGKEHAKDTVPRVNGGTAGGSLAWTANDAGFYYTRYPHEGERPAADLSVYQQVYFHKLGADVTKDVYAIGKDFPRIAEVTLESSPDGSTVTALVANGDGGDFELYVHKDGGAWSLLAKVEDRIAGRKFGPDGTLYLLSHEKPRGEILRLSPATLPLTKASVLVPESDAVIESFVPTSTSLYVTDLVGGPSRLRIVPLHDAKRAKPLATSVPILPVSQVSAVARLAGDDILFRNESYLEPPAWYRYDAKTGQVTKTTLAKKSLADFTDAEVVRESCTSKDGTAVPVSLVQRKGAPRDGSGYALLTGYGGFDIAIPPSFQSLRRLLLDQGVVFAEANLRGGREFGEAWHTAGNVTHKQNVFDDFYACAELLGREKVAGASHLAIDGRSNGGLLMGAELTQHPDAFRVVLAWVGIYDMLKFETTYNGAFTVTEYGSVKDEVQFEAIRAYSPLHNVHDHVAYPSVLFLTGANDPRVEPYNSRKMTARLQAATASPNPILLRTSHDTGHGAGTPLAAQIEQDTDAMAFMLHELGVPFR